MTLSIVIPAWSGTPALRDMLFRLVCQVRPMCDQLVVCEDAGTNEGWAVKNLCDAYFVQSKRRGHARNLHDGLLLTTGDYIGMLDSDVVITEGTMRDLCVEDSFVDARWNEQQGRWATFREWCSVVHRPALERHPLPTDVEDLGDWARSIPLSEIVRSGAVRYSHPIGTSYTALAHQRS